MQMFRVRIFVENADGPPFHSEVILGNVPAESGEKVVEHASTLCEGFVKACAVEKPKE